MISRRRIVGSAAFFVWLARARGGHGETVPSAIAQLSVDRRRLLGALTVQTAGSGCLIDSRGLVLTSRHVIEGSSAIRVSLGPGGPWQTAKVLAEAAFHDLAILQLAPDGPAPRTPLRVAMDVGLRPGDRLTFFGTSGGGTPRASPAVVTQEADPRNGFLDGPTLLRFDGEVRPGDSGAAMIRVGGVVAAVVQAHYAAQPNVGFATPVARALPLIAAAVGRCCLAEPHWLGMSYGDRGGRVQLYGVSQHSELASAGARVGTVVLAINGAPINCAQDLATTLRQARGGRIVLTMETGGSIIKLEVVPTAPPAFNLRAGLILDADDPLQGARAETLQEPSAFAFGCDPALRGVLITAPGDGRAGRSGFQPGDVITYVNSAPTPDVAALRDRLGSSRRWFITLRRGDERLTAEFAAG